MKTSNLLLLALFVISISCNTEKQYQSYGAQINAEAAKPVEVLTEINPEETTSIKLMATVDQVCQSKGCWMTLKNDNGTPIRVTFKDYEFFVPKDISGSSVVVEGELFKKDLSPDMARHYAEDAGEEFDSTKSYTEYALIAEGVLVAKP
ncbi:MAG: DUF4920 domain-containing protein [Cyclobacteriaceae bacterium]